MLHKDAVSPHFLKLEMTQLNRLETLMRASEASQLIKPMRYERKPGERNTNPMTKK